MAQFEIEYTSAGLKQKCRFQFRCGLLLSLNRFVHAVCLLCIVFFGL